MTEGYVPETSPEEASRSGAPSVRDENLPMLAAIWLAQGYDSEELRGLAGLTRQEAREGGRRLLAGVLSSLGWPMRDWWNAPEEVPWPCGFQQAGNGLSCSSGTRTNIRPSASGLTIRSVSTCGHCKRTMSLR